MPNRYVESVKLRAGADAHLRAARPAIGPLRSSSGDLRNTCMRGVRRQSKTLAARRSAR